MLVEARVSRDVLLCRVCHAEIRPNTRESVIKVSGSPVSVVEADNVGRFMNWALMNHYDENGEMIMPRPRGKEADEEKFIRWVCHTVRSKIISHGASSQKEGRTGFP